MLEFAWTAGKQSFPAEIEAWGGGEVSWLKKPFGAFSAVFCLRVSRFRLALEVFREENENGPDPVTISY